VANYSDQKILRAIIDDVYRGAGAGAKMPSIIVQSFSTPKYHVPEFRVALQTIMDVISVDNDTVFNVLINQTDFNKWLLAEASDDKVTKQAIDILHKSLAQEHDRGLKGCILRDVSTLTIRGGATNWIQTPHAFRGDMFVPDQSEVIRQLQTQAQQLDHEVDVHRRKFSEFDQKIRAMVGGVQREKQALVAHRQMTSKMEKELRDLETSIAELSEHVEADTSDVDRQLARYQEDLDDNAKKDEQLSEKVVKLKIQAVSAESEARRAQQESERAGAKDVERQHQTSIVELDKKMKEIKKIQVDIGKLKSDLTADRKKLEEVLRKCHVEKKKVEEQFALIPKKDLKNRPTLQKRIDALDRRINEERVRHRADIEVLEHDMHKAELRLDSMRFEAQSLKQQAEMHEVKLEIRQKEYVV
jgi:hypothetical protein